MTFRPDVINKSHSRPQYSESLNNNIKSRQKQKKDFPNCESETKDMSIRSHKRINFAEENSQDFNLYNNSNPMFISKSYSNRKIKFDPI